MSTCDERDLNLRGDGRRSERCRGNVEETFLTHSHFVPPTRCPNPSTLPHFLAQVKKMIESKGNEGPPPTSRRGRSEAPKEEKKEDTGVSASSAWADFMDDEGAEEGVKLESKVSKAAELVGKNNKYLKVKSDSMEKEEEGRDGILIQTGTLDWDTVGRSKKNASEVGTLDIMEPTVLTRSVFGGRKVRLVAASCTSCHSFAVDVEGRLYGWGRNEAGQVRSIYYFGRWMRILLF